MKNLLLVSSLILFFYACTDAKKAKIGGFGSKFQIEMLNCDGSVARTWISSGKVSSEQNSDGYYFMEEGTDKLIEVTGRLIITKIN
tara:strand:+ start:233 stop:490 length:258 start_codon:yes stop_codon:yes gene_type:complete